MANIMMPPIAAQLASGAGSDLKAQLPIAKEGTFAQHLEREISAGQSEGNNLLGVQAAKGKTITQYERPEDVPATVEAILQQLMADLKDMAKKPVMVEAGQWNFQLKSLGLLEELAGLAGMDAASLAPLKRQMEQQGGLPLADLFAALEKNFKDLATDKKVTVAETNLPLLETFLNKLGVTPEAIQQLDQQGVNGTDQLDLAAYVQGLQRIPASPAGQETPAAFTLSAWELEQFASMLAEAGVPADKIEQLFPERMAMQQKALAGLRPEQGNEPVAMSLDRLKSTLQQALAAAHEARPSPELPGFFTELYTILSQADFQSSDAGWSPVIQGTMKDAYEELQKMVDLAMVKVEKIAAGSLSLTKLADATRDNRPQSATDEIGEGHVSLADLSKALQQVLAKVNDSQGQPADLPEVLAAVRSILSQAGFESETTSPEPTTAVIPPVMNLAEVNKALQQVLSEVEGLRGQPSHLPEIFHKISSILHQAGVESRSARPEATALPPPMNLEDFSQSLQQALAEVEMARTQPTDLPALFSTVKAILQQAGVDSKGTATLATAAEISVALTNEDDETAVNQALTEAEGAPALATLSKVLNKIHTLVAPTGFAGQDATLPAQASAPAVAPAALEQAQDEKQMAPSQATDLASVADRITTISTQADSEGHDNAQPSPLPAAPQTLATLSRLLQQAIDEVEGMRSQPTDLASAVDTLKAILDQAGDAGQHHVQPATTFPPPLPSQPAQGMTKISQGADSAEPAQQRNDLNMTVAPMAAEGHEGQPQPVDLPSGMSTINHSAAASHDLHKMNLTKDSDDKRAENMAQDNEITEAWQASGDEPISGATSSGPNGDLMSGDNASGQLPQEMTAPPSPRDTTADGFAEQIKGTAAFEMKAQEQAQTEVSVRTPMARLRMTSEMQQFAFEQISHGVLRGLRNNDHHLALTLYPKELGEVKVDMQVRGSQLSVTFVAENQKVKEAMEANMGEFKDNLERRGFTLGAMSVSVDQQSNPHDGGKRFVAAWEQMLASQNRADRVAADKAMPLPNYTANQQSTTQTGISLFV